MAGLDIRCGTCAWSDHERFYPDRLAARDRLAYYARYFRLVEVDSSYYRIPDPRSVQSWVANTPDDFVFDVKAYRSLTLHDRGSVNRDELERDADLFEAALNVLEAAGKLGNVLFQFPPWFRRGPGSRAHLEWVRERFARFTVGIEFRHRSWWAGEAAEETARWLRERACVNVVCDEPQVTDGCIPFVPLVTHPKLVVFRLHGRNDRTWAAKGLTSSSQRFDYLYSREELRQFVPYVQRWATEAAEVHILMNNNQGDYAVRNALDWQEILGLPARERPPSGRAGGGDEYGEQTTLFDGISWP
ncbi:MAG: DUF72 domain-containing protein [Alicyclobacillus sp.]|nr:DUF72 domain-containing protein [Alicyclobacillus sp.]